MLSLIFACFISVPVYSGWGDENPWDADNLEEEDLGDTVNIIVEESAGRPTLRATPDDGGGRGLDWLESLAFGLSYQVSVWFKGNNSLSAPMVGM